MINFYRKKQIWKYLILLFAVVIGGASLYYTNKLVDKLAVEERKKVELWAEATQQLGNATLTEGDDLTLAVKIIQENQTVPVILTDNEKNIVTWRNLNINKLHQDKELKAQLQTMAEQNEPIEICLGDNQQNYIYYKNSTILSQLTYYPVVQLSIIMLFIFISYYAFSTSRESEQNKVWVGLSKETAHQLGTPTSSMMGWVELLKNKNTDPEIIAELEKDISRFEKIADRFSKIGSVPRLHPENIAHVLDAIVKYLSTRFSDRVKIILDIQDNDIVLPLNTPLFEWVIENACKNAYDAIPGNGFVLIKAYPHKQKYFIDITDNGKGIQKSMQKSIFKPGFTTKKKGWGLGLSLAKRIVENYHNGKIFVLNSEIGKGTTIRIILDTKA